MYEGTHIEIEQPANTTRYWIPIDVATQFDTEANQQAMAKKMNQWNPESADTPHVAIAKAIRRTFRSIFREAYVEAQNAQINETLNTVLPLE